MYNDRGPANDDGSEILQQEFPLVDSILEQWRDEVGSHYQAYRNHICRVLNFCFIIHRCEGDDEEKLTIAGCFHDLGIWTHKTFDYLQPSIELATSWLDRNDRAEWSREVELMIDLHHRWREVRDAEHPLVEVFRKGDWIDASLGWRRFGVPRGVVKQVQRAFPNCGFHKAVVQQALRRMRTHPLSPLPMMKW